MKTIDIEYAIIGAGTAGLGAYSVISRQTDSLVMIQDGPYGTTCARVGCMPSKLLITAADYAHSLDSCEFFGIHAQGAVDSQQVLQRLRRERDHSFVGRNLSYVNKIPAHHKLEGRARFIGPGRLLVGEHIQVNADKVIIACGSRPLVNDVFRPVRSRVLTSDTIFEIQDLPKSIAVIGLGVIALELGQALHRLGVETTIYGRSGAIGGLTSSALQKQTLQIFQSELDIYPSGTVQRTWMSEQGACIEFQQDNGDVVSKVFDQVLVATGRVSNVDRLDLPAAGIEPASSSEVPFDQHSLAYPGHPVFVAGDASGLLPVWHAAFDEGRIAANNAMIYPAANAPKRRVPLMIYFTDPQMAIVGCSHQDLQGQPVVVGELPFNASPRHVVWNKVQGHMQIYVDPHSRIILGAELLGERSEHIAHLLALAMTHSMTVDQVLEMPIYHPSAEELLRDVLIDAQKKLRIKDSVSVSAA